MIDFLLPGHYRVGLSNARVMDEDRGVVVSLGDCVGPFQPYVKGGEEEQVEVCSQGHEVMRDLEVRLVQRGDLSLGHETSDTLVFEEEVAVTLPPHAYSKGGKIPPGTYSRETLSGLRGRGPLLKRSHLGQMPSVVPKMDVNVVCHVVEPEVGSYAEMARGKPKCIKSNQ